MKKKILSILLIGIFIVGFIGCGNSNSNNKDSNTGSNNNEKNDNNNLTCSGTTSLMLDIFISQKDGSDEYTSIEFSSNGYTENSEYAFVYDNDVLTSVIGKETFKKSFSAEITDEQIKEENEKEDYKVYRDRNNKINFEYTLDQNNDLVKLLRNKNNLKEWLEENTDLTCSGK